MSKSGTSRPATVRQSSGRSICRKKADRTTCCKDSGTMKLYDVTFAEIISILQENAMPNPFCHVELNTTDVKKAKEFYGKLFNWKLEDMPGGNYTMIGVGEGTGGGMMKHPIPAAQSFWLSYILCDDVQASTKKAAALGCPVMK